VRDVGRDVLGAGVEQGLGGVDQGAARIDDVVDEDAGAALDLADDVHHLGLARALAALVDDGQRAVDPLGNGAGPDHAAHVRRHHHPVGARQPLLDVAHHHGGGEQVVGGDVEEALDLAGMEIEGQDAVGAGLGDEVRHQLGRDRGAAGGAPVLPRVAEVRDHRRDAPGRGPARGVDHDQQLHQVVVRRERGRLDDEHVLAAHVLLELDEDLHVGEAPDHALGERQFEIGRDRLGQGPAGIPGDDLDRGFHGRPLAGGRTSRRSCSDRSPEEPERSDDGRGS
jgi:hypothetical protein